MRHAGRNDSDVHADADDQGEPAVIQSVALEKNARAFLVVDQEIVRPFERKAWMIKAGQRGSRVEKREAGDKPQLRRVGSLAGIHKQETA